MRRLSQTLARLGALSNLPQMPGMAGSSHLDELTGFGSNPGALRGWTCVPDDLAPGAALVVVLHGCTQTAAGYDHGAGWSQLAQEHGFAVLLPEQQRANNPNACFNWFVSEDIARGQGEAASIAQMVAAMTATHGIDPARVFVTGLSAGGAMACVMLATYPELFAGGAIIAGLPYGTATGVREALDRMHGQGGLTGQGLSDRVRAASSHRGPWPSVSVWHGTADATVAPSNATAIVDQWHGLHGPLATPVTDRVDGQVRTRWHDRDGRVVIERYDIAGLGHGTPLATTGAEACGAAGPYMLEAGISSTRHIARSWNLLVGSPRRTASPTKPSRAAAPAGRIDPAKIVADALRAAGLSR